MSEITNGSKKKREAKFDIKDISHMQKEALQQETERYDHEVIDEENEEFLKAAKQKRKLHRKHN